MANRSSRRSRTTLAWALFLLIGGCGNSPTPVNLLDAFTSAAPAADHELVVRFAHISDSHIVDIASPARLTAADWITTSAWRPQEPYATQMLDGVIRAVNRMHASGESIDFLIHTGDATDNVQHNELDWFFATMTGQIVTPRSGPDDRPIAERPPPHLDPFASFQAQGLYQEERHGPAPTIPWYLAVGNHDAFAMGVWPIITQSDGSRTAPLPLPGRPGLLLPVELDPTGSRAYGPTTPATTWPPPLLSPPATITPNAERAYYARAHFAQVTSDATGQPNLNDLALTPQRMWYSVRPLPGLRLIVLDTTTVSNSVPGGVYVAGGLSRTQFDFLAHELAQAESAGELVILASHHPSDNLLPSHASDVTTAELHALLSASPAIILHIAGHTHKNRVVQRAGYVEIETGATIAPPLEGRIIEVWHDPVTRDVAIAYRMFSDQVEHLPPLGDDPLAALRAVARAHALNDKRPGKPDQRTAVDTEAASHGPRSGWIWLR